MQGWRVGACCHVIVAVVAVTVVVVGRDEVRRYFFDWDVLGFWCSAW